MNLDDSAFLRELGDRIPRRDARARGLTQAQARRVRAPLHRTFIGSVRLRGERNVSLLNLRAMTRAPAVCRWASSSRDSPTVSRGREKEAPCPVRAVRPIDHDARRGARNGTLIRREMDSRAFPAEGLCPGRSRGYIVLPQRGHNWHVKARSARGGVREGPHWPIYSFALSDREFCRRGPRTRLRPDGHPHEERERTRRGGWSALDPRGRREVSPRASRSGPTASMSETKAAELRPTARGAPGSDSAVGVRQHPGGAHRANDGGSSTRSGPTRAGSATATLPRACPATGSTSCRGEVSHRRVPGPGGAGDAAAEGQAARIALRRRDDPLQGGRPAALTRT